MIVLEMLGLDMPDNDFLLRRPGCQWSVRREYLGPHMARALSSATVIEAGPKYRVLDADLELLLAAARQETEMMIPAKQLLRLYTDHADD